MRSDERVDALRDSVTELLSMPEPRKRFAAMMSGLDIRYDLGDGHPLLGRRMPDLDLGTPDGPLRTFTLLHDARPVLLNFGGPGGFDIAPWANRVWSIDVKYDGVWELPVLGAVPAPTAVLIRPDGHVAWVGERTHAGLPEALSTWFGPPTPASYAASPGYLLIAEQVLGMIRYFSRGPWVKRLPCRGCAGPLLVAVLQMCYREFHETA